MSNKKYVFGLMSLAVLASLAIAVPALAQTTPPGNGSAMWGNHVGKGMMGHPGMMKPGVFGTVTAINGNSLTVSGKQGFGATATTTNYTVDATNATVMKNNATSSVSAIAVGDTVMVAGTVSGVNVAATMIRDGVMTRGTKNPVGSTPMNQISPISGNGQPVVAGTVSGINGSSLTITNKSNASYTIDTSSAKIVQGQNTITISGITTGDMVFVQGTVNGNSIVATSVIDQKTPSATANAIGTTTPPQSKGFFGSIGAFFSHLFG
ncbi:MAG: DUF5666 domain-containing protein, partial [Minisyncoccia bacterium]